MSSLRLEPASLLRDQQTVMQSRQSQLYSAKIRYKWLKVILHIVCAPFLSPGIRLFDDQVRSTDAGRASALSHELDKIDIYSNSWGPGDNAVEVEGPETLTERAIELGIKQVIHRFSQGQKQSSRGMLYKMSFSIHSTFAVYWKQTEFRARVELRCEQYNAISQIQPNGYVMSTDLNKLTGTGFYFQPAKSYQFFAKQWLVGS